jgi:hypothetical protein
MAPVNGSKFDPSSQILVDLGNRGFLDPASISIRYRISYTVGTSGDVISLVGTPAYTPILRLDTLVNSQTVETINNYSVVANMWANLSMSIADKMGVQYPFGYTNDLTNDNTDGGSITTTATTTYKYYSVPLVGLLGSSEKLIPLFLMNNIRLAFTLDTVANIQTAISANVKATAFQIDNFEVVYNMVDFGREVEQQIITENPKVRIKSSSFATSLAPQLASGSAGSQTLSFNLRYASVKSAFLNFGGADATKSASRNLDSYDVAQGDYQLQIGGVNFPQKALSTLNNKGGCFQELRRAMGSIFGKSVALSISGDEYNLPTGTYATATTPVRPGKFWLGVNLQKLTISEKAWFTGISTQMSPINVNLNIGTTTTQAFNPMLILYYDSIIEVDSQTKQIMMIQ